MEQLKKTRTYARGSFTRAFTAYTHETRKEPIQTRDINVAFNLLKSKHTELEVLNQKIFNAMIETNSSDEDVAAEVDSADEYRVRYLQAETDVTNMNEAIRQANAAPPQGIGVGNVVMQQEVKRNYTLPKIQFQKYGGDLREWLHFWSQFKKIHEDANMNKDDKFYYLLQHILPNSKASELVGSFPPTGNMYDQVIISLKNRFGRDELLVEFYVRELLKLVLTNALAASARTPLSTLYDRLETHIRSLESLGVTTDTCAAMLYPLVESSLPEDLLRTWQRQTSMNNAINEANGNNGIEAAAAPTSKDRLTKLMNFLQAEVENEQRITMAMAGFGLKNEQLPQLPQHKRNQKKEFNSEIPSAAGLLTANDNETDQCIFCKDNHDNVDCDKAKKLSLAERQEIAKKKKVCFRCLKPQHNAKWCKTKIKCTWCEGKHTILMCRNLNKNFTAQISEHEKKEVIEANLANLSLSTEVLLLTVQVKIRHQDKERVVRAILDCASHRSYILNQTAQEMGYEPIGEQKMIHLLFGGTRTEPKEHKGYLIHLKSLDNSYACNFVALGEEKICHSFTHASSKPLIQELREKRIRLNDNPESNEPISLLIGADVLGKLMTGKKIDLDCGPTAFETRFGWSLMGKNLSAQTSRTDTALLVTSMFVHEASVTDLWNLDVLGITDPTQTKTKEVLQEEVKEKFRQTVKINNTGRYEVLLPWKENHPPLVDNRVIAEKRLKSTTKKLEHEKLREQYHRVLESWLTEGIIERVPASEVEQHGYYLPHRHVLKENSTTPIRPVFDASARGKNSPSLNQCLETGPNLIELIPTMLMRFRQKQIGVIADIKKAFLQISVSPRDRDVLRFLWWKEDRPEKLEVYRHCRVVFGVSSSPFLLGATIELHLEQALEQATSDVQRKSIQKLLESFYVDNCISSVDNQDELNDFIHESTSVMASGKFELRGWEYSKMHSSNNTTSVLGLTWDKQDDTLMLTQSALEIPIPEIITKRVILSAAQKIFDPIGIACPVLLQPKLLLQKLWSKSFDWDEEVNEEVSRNFREWHQQTGLLKELRIPRWMFGDESNNITVSLHVFVDASKDAYAAALFARSQTLQGVEIQLIEAKTRVAPMSKTTIPRLELLAATVGARLMDFTSKALQLEYTEKFYWSDSSAVLSWIQQEKQWGTFVWNRVQEIRRISDPLKWRHVPGAWNPADLPSRGCSAKQLIDSRWWEGPDWLRENPDKWPSNEFNVNETEVNTELRKSSSKRNMPLEEKQVHPFPDQILLTVQSGNKCTPRTATSEQPWYMGESSQYSQIVRRMAWILRFISNCRRQRIDRLVGEFSVQEITSAESRIFRLTQEETFNGEKDPRLSSLCAFTDSTGLIRLKTLISNREDNFGFTNPVVLDHQHPLVTRLIEHKHRELNHAGIQIVMSCLREQVWILSSRRAIRSVLQKCNTCKRYTSSHLEAPPGQLPEPRVRDAAVFEVTGVDLAGPLYLKGGQKAWICLFTCAVYRAIHLELITSLSTEAFLEALRRFIARRGRPSIIYSDNGTNFRGTNNLLKAVDWDKISKFSTLLKIEWRFNPPTAAWWGGWWERLVRSVKELLRKVLRKACLTYQEMNTTLCDCESIINARPITYLSEDASELVPLTPAMFLQGINETGVPDLDQIEHQQLQKRFRYRLKIRHDLRLRFRSEYLGQLSRKRSWKNGGVSIQKGDVVLVSNDNQKRLDWPLGLVLDVIPGKDGEVRVVKLKTANGELIRPVQKLYPLEMSPRMKDENLSEGNDTIRPKSLRKLQAVPHTSEINSATDEVSAVEVPVPASVPEENIKDKGDIPKKETRTRRGRVIKPVQRLSL